MTCKGILWAHAQPSLLCSRVGRVWCFISGRAEGRGWQRHWCDLTWLRLVKDAPGRRGFQSGPRRAAPPPTSAFPSSLPFLHSIARSTRLLLLLVCLGVAPCSLLANFSVVSCVSYRFSLHPLTASVTAAWWCEGAGLTSLSVTVTSLWVNLLRVKANQGYLSVKPTQKRTARVILVRLRSGRALPVKIAVIWAYPLLTSYGSWCSLLKSSWSGHSEHASQVEGDEKELFISFNQCWFAARCGLLVAYFRFWYKKPTEKRPSSN